MKWWTHSSLRTKIFLCFAALILAVLIAALGLTQWVLSRDAQRRVNGDLLTTTHVFDGLVAERAARLSTNATLLASDFALKRVIATHFDPQTYDPDTLASAAVNYQQRIGVELLWIVDENGTLLASSPAAMQVGASVDTLSPLNEALGSGEAAGAIAEVRDGLFQLVAVPVLGPDPIGYLVIGHSIDDAFARRLKRDTGTDVSFITPGRILASSWPASQRDDVMPSQRSQLLKSRDAAQLIETSKGRLLTRVVAIDASLSEPLFALVQGSYDAALAPLRSMQRRIAVIGVVALALALLVGVAVANGITSPVKSLVAGMREVFTGNLHYRSPIRRDDEIGYLATSFNEMVSGLEERERIKDTFGRFVSHEVAEAVLGGHIPLQGERREVSILFQDIRGFTALSRQLDPTTLLRFLNQFFTEAVAAVEAEGGVVKQFTGDGLMALFGAPREYPDHAQRAVRAALGIVGRLHALNTDLQRQGLPSVAIGVGVHAGEVVAGLIGPDARVEYGVVGEAVNLASRVEALTKEMQAVVLVSRQIADRLGDAFVFGRTAVMPVKGLQDVEVVEIIGYRGMTGPAHALRS